MFKLSAQIESGTGIDEGQITDDDGAQLIKVDQNKIFKSVNEVILAI